MARKAVESAWTVKELKARVNLLQNPIASEPKLREEQRVDPNVADAERRLREALGLRVHVKAKNGNKGQVVIRYESVEDFDRILDLLANE
jgi:ParB-like chromosome segregation protein Spo0J